MAVGVTSLVVAVIDMTLMTFLPSGPRNRPLTLSLLTVLFVALGIGVVCAVTGMILDSQRRD